MIGGRFYPYWELAYEEEEEAYLEQKLVDRLTAGGIAARVLEPGARDPDGVS